MEVDTLPVGPLQTNCYLITCPRTRDALLIDPGWDDSSIHNAIADRRARVRLVANTHAHFDHIGGNAALIRGTAAQFAIHETELPLLRSGGGADAWGIPIEPSPEPNRLLNEGQILEIGMLRFKVLFTPGHSPGHVSFYEEEHHALFDGDVLFKLGIGRTDLPGGNALMLFDSIRTVIMKLPEETIIYPGHGPTTTVGDELRLNPWIG